MTTTRVATPPAIALLIGLGAAPAGAQDQHWLRQFGTAGHDHPRALVADGAGGAFVAGIVTGPGGDADAWLSHADAAGTMLWTRQFGAPGLSDDDVDVLLPDGQGGVYVAGVTSGDLFAAKTGFEDAWLARYDASGVRLWGRQFGAYGRVNVVALVPDGAGGLLAAGEALGDLAGPGSAGGLIDPWVARYSAAGDRLWIRQIGTEFFDEVRGAASDGAGGAFIAGYTNGTLGDLSRGGADAWIARYDGAGDLLWVRQFGSASGDAAYAIAPDGAGGAIVAGVTGGDLAGENAGGSDVFLARFDAAGDQTWARQFGGEADDHPRMVVTSGHGGIVLAGLTEGGIVGPGAGGLDIWIAGFGAAGTQSWVHQLGTAADDTIVSLVPDGAGGVVAAGNTRGGLARPGAGGTDAWLARYRAGGERAWIRQFAAPYSDWVWHLAPLGEGGFLAAGDTDGGLGGPLLGGYDAWLGSFDAGPACAGDWTNNDAVNSNDISAFLAAWLSSLQSGTLDGDVNADNTVNSADISAFLSAWLDAVQHGC